MIPNKIFFIWFGSNLPWTAGLAILSAYKIQMPEEITLYYNDSIPTGEGYELIKNIPTLKFEKIIPDYFENLEDGGITYKLYNELPSPATKANLLRLALLYKQGGIYLDTDVIVVRPIKHLLNQNGFCGTEPVALPQDLFSSLNILRWIGCGLKFAFREFCARIPRGYSVFRLLEGKFTAAANNAVLASVPHNSLIKQAFLTIAKMPSKEQHKRFRLGTHLLQRLTRNQSSSEMTVYPSSFFYPLGPEISAHWFYSGTDKKLDDLLFADTCIVHWYNSVEGRFLKEKLDKNWIHNHPNTAFSAMAQKILSL
jgi:hypothetical protein